jgi:C4-dicarboxylate transporter
VLASALFAMIGAGVALIGLSDALLRIASASNALFPLAAVACLGGAFGRTMSPVSAVVVYGSGLVGTSPLLVIRHLLPALLAGGVVAMAVALR